MLHLPKQTRTAFCPRCNAERPYRRQPVMGKHGPLKRKMPVCIACGTHVHVQSWSTAKPTMGSTGRMRPSQAEAAREDSLVDLQRAGVIRDLRMCNDPPEEVYSLDIYGTCEVEALLERIEAMPPQMGASLHRLAHEVRLARHHIQRYRPDFSYTTVSDGRRHVIDEKGRAKESFSKTRKLMLACHGIEVEVTRVSAQEVSRFKRKRGIA